MRASFTRMLGAAVLGLFAGAAVAQSLPDVIKLGVLNDMAGPYSASSGMGTVAAARMAVEDFGGKLLGRPVEIIIGDNQTKPDVAASIAGQWMADGVAAVVDGGSSATTLAVLPTVRDHDRTFIFTSPASTALTNESCSPNSVQFTYDSYSLAKALVTPIVKEMPHAKWFFITANYAAGASTQDAMTNIIQAGGGTIVGTTKHPIGQSDFSSFLLQAQSSKADVIGLVNFSADLANTLKQSSEFGVGNDGKQRFAIPLIFLPDIKSVGLDHMPGMLTGLSFYWDMNDATRAFAKRFAARMNGQYPDETHAGAYSGVLHYLKAAEAAGLLSGKAVVQKMKAIPVNDFYNTNVQVRIDGRVMNNFYLAKLKTAAESHGPYDYFSIQSTIPGGEAFQPLSQSTCPMVAKG